VGGVPLQRQNGTKKYFYPRFFNFQTFHKFRVSVVKNPIEKAIVL